MTGPWDPAPLSRPWLRGEILLPTVHDIWCRRGPSEPWRIHFMLDESEGGEWFSRRNPRLRRPLADLGARTSAEIPYLAPECSCSPSPAGPAPRTSRTSLLHCLCCTAISGDGSRKRPGRRIRGATA
jgi:hypothetical protein